MRFTNKFLLILSLMILSSTACFAQDTMKKDEMKKDEMSKESMMKDDKTDKRPTVVAIRADWCPYCKKLEPIMMDLMKEYGERLNFVVFDITNDQTIAASKQLAKEKGLEEFFEKNKGKSAFVAIIKDNKQVFSAKYDTKRDTYVEAFDKALLK